MAVIAINTRFLIKDRMEGLGMYTYEVCKRLTLQHPEHTFHFLFDRAFNPDFLFAENIIPVKILPPARHPFLWYYWFEYAIPSYLAQIKPNVFFSPDGFASLKTTIPQVITTHDLAFEHYPEYVPFLVRKYYKHFAPKYHRKVNKIISISNSTRNDIQTFYNTEASKIDVIHNGVNNAYRPMPNEIKQDTKKKYSNGLDYFVFVGALHPRKNISGLLKAFDSFKTNTKSSKKLVIVGREAWQNESMKMTYENMQFKNDVIFTGHLTTDELKRVIGSAFALCYVSLFEGFGLPLVEAMQAEIPIITSNVSSMPEICGNAGIIVNPHDVNAIANAMQLLEDNSQLRNTLSENGKQQVTKFNWDFTAEKVYKVLAEVGNFV